MSILGHHSGVELANASVRRCEQWANIGRINGCGFNANDDLIRLERGNGRCFNNAELDVVLAIFLNNGLCDPIVGKNWQSRLLYALGGRRLYY